MKDERRWAEIARFLRERRHELSPAELGLSPGRRRRTPGLRREEVAARAGISPTWYALLERGRSNGVARATLRRIADALQLTAANRAYLLSLGDDEAVGGATSAQLPQAASQLLDQLLPWPAYVRDAGWNVISWNRTAQALFDFERHTADAPQNFVRRFFTDAAYRTLYVSWDGTADQIVARLRTAYAMAGPELVAVVDDLRLNCADFRRRWDARVVVQADAVCAAEFMHAAAGILTCDVALFAVVGSPGYVVVTLIPVTAGTLERLRQMDLAGNGLALTPTG